MKYIFVDPLHSVNGQIPPFGTLSLSKLFPFNTTVLIFRLIQSFSVVKDEEERGRFFPHKILFSYFSLHGQFSTLPLSALLLLCFTQLPCFRHSLQPSQNSPRHIILSPIVFLFIENFETGPRLFLIYLAFSLSQSSVASKTHPLS